MIVWACRREGRENFLPAWPQGGVGSGLVLVERVQDLPTHGLHLPTSTPQSARGQSVLRVLRFAVFAPASRVLNLQTLVAFTTPQAPLGLKEVLCLN